MEYINNFSDVHFLSQGSKLQINMLSSWYFSNALSGCLLFDLEKYICLLHVLLFQLISSHCTQKAIAIAIFLKSGVCEMVEVKAEGYLAAQLNYHGPNLSGISMQRSYSTLQYSFNIYQIFSK